MSITLIGAVSIVLSLIALVLNNDKMLLKLVIIFSVFTAAIALDFHLVILPYEIPMALWLFKQIYKSLKNKELSLNKFKDTLKNNKIFTALLILIIVIIISEVYLLVSRINYNYYDVTYKEDRVITFKSTSVTQSARICIYLLFAMILSVRLKSKQEIKELLKVFGIVTIFAIIWGFIQYFMYYLNIRYPAFLFNNNPYAAQGYGQMMFFVKRISSIALEPSTFSLNLALFVPLVLVTLIEIKKEKTSQKYRIGLLVVTIMAITCALLTTSTTAWASLAVLYFVLLVYNIKNKNFKKIIQITVYFAISFIIFAICCFAGNALSKATNINNNVSTSSSKNGLINTVENVTTKKLDSGSGHERLQRELDGLKIYQMSPIFGVGYFSFRTFTLFTNVLVNMGIFGVLSILYIFFVVIKQLWKNRKGNRTIVLTFFLCVLEMFFAYLISIPDLSYIYCWTILVFAYKYFDLKDNKKIEKDYITIGVDARGLDGNKTGISTYIDELFKKINDLPDNQKIKFVLYSTRPINLSFKVNENLEVKYITKYKKGVIFTRFQIPKMLKDDNVDIFWGTQHLLPIRNNYTENIKYVLTVHDLAIHKLKTVGSFKNTIIHRLFFKRSCLEADRIVADSESTKNDLIKIFGIEEEKINVVYLGTNYTRDYNISNEQEKEIFEKFNVSRGKYLLFVSTIEPRKNIITIVKAFNEFKKDKKFSEYKLILAGGLGWKYEEILKAIENSDYKDSINLTGYISKDEKECLMHNAKCFVYPSLYEGFGLPILEAMQKGIVVITSNVSSIPEVGGDVPFYLNNVLDEKELAELMKKAIELDEKDIKIIVEKGYKQVDKFTWEKCSLETLEVIKELI